MRRKKVPLSTGQTVLAKTRKRHRPSAWLEVIAKEGNLNAPAEVATTKLVADDDNFPNLHPDPHLSRSGGNNSDETAGAEVYEKDAEDRANGCFVNDPADEEEVVTPLSILKVGDTSVDGTLDVPAPPNTSIDMEEMERLHSVHSRASYSTAQEYLKIACRKIQPWSNVLGLILVCGSVRYTVPQYSEIRDLLAWFAPDVHLPSYSAIQRTVFPHVLQNCFVKSSIELFPLDVWKARPFQARCPIRVNETIDQGPVQQKAPARIVLPSEWAKIDVATKPIYDVLFRSSRDASSLDESIESSVIVRDRASVVNACEWMFVSYNGRMVKAFPGAKLRVQMQYADPRSRLLHDGCSRLEEQCMEEYIERTTQNGCIITGVVSAVWCVGSEKSETPSGQNARRKLKGVEQRLYNKLARARPPVRRKVPTSSRTRNKGRRALKAGEDPLQSLTSSLGPYIVPGDICCLLQPTGCVQSNGIRVIIVSRYWKQLSGLRSEKVLILRTLEEERSEQNADQHILGDILQRRDVVGHHNLCGSVNVSCDNEDDLEKACGVDMRKVTRFPCKGHLEDGTPYVVYRFLLYSDDFKPGNAIVPQGSAGGCYLLPLGLLPRDRTTRSSTRLISLTPPGVSTNLVMLHIIPDILNATVYGVDGMTPEGDRVKIFLDLVGYLGDYLESYHGTDLIGHRGNAPCTVCSFRKYSGGPKSSMGYTCSIHGMNSAWLRVGERHWALRESGIDDEDCKLLGMHGNAKVTNESCPLIVLQKELEKVRSDISRADSGTPVVPGLFDAYRSNIVAPDHLLSGVAQDILEVSFAVLPSNECRQEMDIMICSAIAENGLLGQQSVYNVSKRKLHGMSLSALFCVLFVSLPVYKSVVMRLDAQGDTAGVVLEALNDLHRLISLTYWWPKSGVDGFVDVQSFLQQGRAAYISELQKLAVSYVQKVNDLCGDVQDARKEMDMPNLHRLLELYFHTLPSFGHVRHFTELVLENTHQPLKRCIMRSNHKNAQVSAMDHCLGNDWQARISLLHEGLQNCEGRNEDGYRSGLRRLVIGHPIEDVDRRTSEGLKCLQEADRITASVLIEPLVGRLSSDRNGMRLGSGKTKWVSVGNLSSQEQAAIPIGSGRTVDVRKLLENADTMLRVHFPEYGEGEGWDLRTCRHAKRVKNLLHGKLQQSCNAYEVLYSGCVLQALLPRECLRRADRLLFPVRGKSRASDIVAFYAVVGIVQRPFEEPWAVVVSCQVRDRIIRVDSRLEAHHVSLILLSGSVRRVAIVHACAVSGSGNCRPDLRSRKVGHRGGLLSGEPFYFFGRKEGYPPRIS